MYTLYSRRWASEIQLVAAPALAPSEPNDAGHVRRDDDRRCFERRERAGDRDGRDIALMPTQATLRATPGSIDPGWLRSRRSPGRCPRIVRRALRHAGAPHSRRPRYASSSRHAGLISGRPSSRRASVRHGVRADQGMRNVQGPQNAEDRIQAHRASADGERGRPSRRVAAICRRAVPRSTPCVAMYAASPSRLRRSATSTRSAGVMASRCSRSVRATFCATRLGMRPVYAAEWPMPRSPPTVIRPRAPTAGA